MKYFQFVKCLHNFLPIYHSEYYSVCILLLSYTRHDNLEGYHNIQTEKKKYFKTKYTLKVILELLASITGLYEFLGKIYLF